jgi:acetolactate synthase I/II/III large subunit
MTDRTEIERPTDRNGDGLLEPHGMDEAGEAVDTPEATAEARAPQADAPASDALEAVAPPEPLAVPAPEEPEFVPADEPPLEPPEPPEREPGPEPDLQPPAEPPIEPPLEPAIEPLIEPPAEPAEAVPPPAARSVARLIADTLHANGVKFAFTVPGESFLGLLESFADAGIRVIATRHESGAAFMAEAYGQLTGRPAACLATRAVGASNLAIGIHTARADSTPMFALVGQVERRHRGREAFQEADLAGTVGGLATWAGEITAPETASAVLADATKQALAGRPGPVLISCPEDLLDVDAPAGAAVSPVRPPVSRPDPSDVRSVIQLLASAERPVIVAGAGVLRARCSRELVRFAELLEAPVVASWRRGDVFPNDHPLYLGMSGYYASPAARERLTSADAMLVLGCRLNEPTSLEYAVPGPSVRWARVDLDPTPVEAPHPTPDLAIESDAAVFLRAAIARLERGVIDAQVVGRRQATTRAAREAYEAGTIVDRGEWDGPGVHPGRIVATLREVLPDEAIVTTDAGNFGGWLARGFRFRRPATFLGPTSGAMGYALPAAIAAGIVHRDRPVVAVAGDGGFAMTMNELETAVRERVRPVALVFDNERYGTIRMHQERRESGRTPGTDLGPIDFALAAQAFGARGVRVETTDAFEPALREALAADRPTVLHLPLDRRWVSVDQSPVG